MAHRVFLAVVLLVCLASLVVPTGCSSVYAEGAYARIGHVQLDGLPHGPQARIRAVIEGHADPIARGQALWNAARQFEREDAFDAALVAYQEALVTGALPAESIERQIRLCRARLVVDKRWADADLRRAAGAMDTARGLGLFREVARTVADNYVDDLSYRRLLEAGLDNLRAAAASPEFARHLGLADDMTRRAAFLGALGAVRNGLAEEKDLSSFTARYYVRRVCEENRRTLRLPDGVIISEFIFGAVEHLDAYSAYLTGEMYAALKEDLRGEFVGLGIEVRKEANRLLIVSVFDGGPAARAQLMPGDVLVAVDDTDTTKLELNRIVKLLRGKKDTDVRVTVRRSDETLTLTVTRDTIDVPSVRCAARLGAEGEFGYIRISNFQASTGAEVSRALDAFQKQSSLDGMILDLRGNPGGLLDAAVQVCSLFLDSGTVVSTEGRGFAQTRTYRVSHWRFDRHDQALVVLTDRQSASASEIVAAALKHHRRATLVGEQTYGKGLVQSVLPVEVGRSAVYLTTARFVDPSGTSFHGTGVTPDVVVRPASPPRIRSDAPDPQADPALAKALEVLAAGTVEHVARESEPAGNIAAQLLPTP